MESINSKYDVIIIGGGLAGLCNAIHLSKHKIKVLLIEKNSYPKHKVCGEYISNEVLPYLKFLDFNPFKFGAEKIEKFQLSTTKNKSLSTELPLGGFGISRYSIDYHLLKNAISSGTMFLEDMVIEVNFINDNFTVRTKENKSFSSKIVVGSFGKRSLLDVNLNRKFIKKKSPYLGVKIHVKGKFPKDLVALHNFKGGYCGVSKVENDIINLCYITTFSSFKKYKSINDFEKNEIYKNNYLKEIFKNSKPLWAKPLSISQISFETKELINKHIIFCGDAAGMIHPLCGNGMSMAIQSAQIASPLIIKFLKKEITRNQLEKKYISEWNNQFKWRLKAGHTIATLFRKHWVANFLLSVIKNLPFLLPLIIKQTHGKPIKL